MARETRSSAWQDRRFCSRTHLTDRKQRTHTVNSTRHGTSRKHTVSRCQLKRRNLDEYHCKRECTRQSAMRHCNGRNGRSLLAVSSLVTHRGDRDRGARSESFVRGEENELQASQNSNKTKRKNGKTASDRKWIHRSENLITMNIYTISANSLTRAKVDFAKGLFRFNVGFSM